MTKKLKFIWQYARKYKITFITQELCLVTESVIRVIFPLLLGLIVDEVFIHKNSSFFISGFLIYGLFFLISYILFMFHAFTWQYLVNNFVLDIRRSIFKHAIYAFASFFSDIKTGDIQQRINEDSYHFIHIIQRNLFHFINNIFQFVFSLAALLLINPFLGSAYAVIIPVTVFFTRYLGKKTKAINSQLRNNHGEFISWIYEILKGIVDIRLNNAISWSKGKFNRDYTKLVRLSVKSGKIDLITDRLSNLMILFSDIFLYVTAGIFAINGNMSIGLFITVAEYIRLMNRMMHGITSNFMDLQKRSSSLERVIEIATMETENEEEGKGLPFPETFSSICFNNISFGYNKETNILKNISFEVQRGERIAVVGTSGSGKSTLMQLLLRFYTPQKGEISLNDIPLCDYSITGIRKNISIVHQDFSIFNDTLRNNLTLGDSNISDEDIYTSCSKAHITELIEQLPKGLDTYIGINGIDVSGGQKQRIALARILIKNTACIILDEATSSLDYETEQIIKENIDTFCPDKTLFVIAHRLSTLLSCDRVIILNDGILVSEGNHFDLLKSCSYYKNLFEEQFQTIK